jgi:hypothetical protein
MSTTPNSDLIDFKLVYSENVGFDLQNKPKYKHTKIEALPKLTYDFAIGENWKATDYRVDNNWDNIFKWFSNYWNIKNEFSEDLNQQKISRFKTNQMLYEEDLQNSILNAIESTNIKWKEKVRVDFENEFDDKLVKFIKSKEL